MSVENNFFVSEVSTNLAHKKIRLAKVVGGKSPVTICNISMLRLRGERGKRKKIILLLYTRLKDL